MEKNSLIFKMMKITKYLRMNLEKDLENYDLTFNEFSTLAILKEHGAVPVQKIAKKIDITSGSMTYIVNKLIKNDFIIKTKSSEDTRVYLLKLSIQGEEFFNKISKPHFNYAKNLMRSIMNDVSEKELDEILSSMTDNIKKLIN